MIDNLSVAGVICEYNPFHNGHLYQIETIKKSGYDFVVCVMSGAFVQRGDLAIYDKWERAKTAVENGADLVIELPTYYVLQSAQNFAHGGVKILDSLGFVDALVFGSESDDGKKLVKMADVIGEETGEFKTILSESLKSGDGYPKAYEKAISASLGEEITLLPNDILAINYISQLKKLGSSIVPVPMKRKGDYHSKTHSHGSFASATEVRDMINKGLDITDLVPDTCDITFSLDNIESYVLGVLRSKDEHQLKNVPGMEQGLARRIITCAKESSTLDEFFSSCTTKRYTKSRIGRITLGILLDIDGDSILDYLRVLAFKSDSSNLLSEIKKKCPLPLVTKVADFVPGEKSMFRYDILSTDIASLACSDILKRKSGRDYITSPVIVR